MASTGHGTYTDDEHLVASVAGVVERVNRLICVRPLNTRYNGEIGDVVIGRITEVQQKRWKVDTESRLDSVLLLSSVNLPGGELRRRSAEDELAMRDYLKEGDLISAEVQSIFSDGALSLHTRSLRYGKVRGRQMYSSHEEICGDQWHLIFILFALEGEPISPYLQFSPYFLPLIPTFQLGQGVLVKVSPSLILRSKTHFHHLASGASIILGNNGLVWLQPANSAVEAGGFVTDLEPVPISEREVISRLRNCVIILAHHRLALSDTSVTYCYEASMAHEIKDITKPEISEEILLETRQRLLEQRG
uniref:Exosome component 2 n=1 Tax=Eptatretus burgeri TaxID=7764 RepID=A0A8C4QCP9_EPTBU